MVEAAVAKQVVDTPGRSGLLVPRAEHHPRYARGENRSGAQHAGLERHDEGRVGEVPIRPKFRRTANRNDLGVRGGIEGLLTLVPAVREHRAVGIQNHRPHGHIPGREGEFGFRERETHRGEI